MHLALLVGLLASAPQAAAHLCCAMESAVHVEYFADHARLEPLLFEGTIEPIDGRLRVARNSCMSRWRRITRNAPLPYGIRSERTGTSPPTAESDRLPHAQRARVCSVGLRDAR